MTAAHEVEVLVIGAGISGLLCATTLQAEGRTVCVVDKGRGVGGRMATRRIGAARFDHGAQFFNAFKREFQTLAQAWRAGGIITEWHRTEGTDRHAAATAPPRYCGVHGMTDVPKHLAATLDVQLSQRITALSHADGRWTAQSETGTVYRAARLVLTAPLPQSLDLLDTVGSPQLSAWVEPLRSIRYARGLALLALLDDASGLPPPGYLELDQPACRWIADNQAKGISPEPCITLHASPAFASRHWESEAAECSRLMLAAAAPHLGANVRDTTCHRWRYAFPVNPWPQPFMGDPANGLWLAGDAFGGSRIEQAACSGLAVARACR